MKHPYRAFLCLCVLLLFGLSAPAHAGGDAEAGKAKSAKCTSCHGAAGKGTVAAPALAGKEAEYLVAAMKAYRDGKRQNPMMAMAVQGLSDADIADLAAYFAAQAP